MTISAVGDDDVSAQNDFENPLARNPSLAEPPAENVGAGAEENVLDELAAIQFDSPREASTPSAPKEPKTPRFEKIPSQYSHTKLAAFVEKKTNDLDSLNTDELHQTLKAMSRWKRGVTDEFAVLNNQWNPSGSGHGHSWGQHRRRKRKEHISENTLVYLEQEEEKRLTHEHVSIDWVLIFDLADNGHDHCTLRDYADGNRWITHEAWALCERCWACELHVEHEITSDGNSLLIKIGIPYKTAVRGAALFVLLV